MSGILLDDIEGFEVLVEACTTANELLLQADQLEYICERRPEELQRELSLVRSVLSTLREASWSLHKTRYALKSRLVQQEKMKKDVMS